MTAKSDRAHDIVVWGATGFTGRLVAEYLAKHAPASLRWAVGGRDRAKLEATRSGLGPPGDRVGVVVHDAASPAAMTELARSARVVCTTVGPYGRYGKALATACAAEGTDYCDLTGEPPFMRWVIDHCDAKAKETGARLVHTCGFDSIPSDLGVYLCAKAAGGPLGRVRLVLTKSRGGASGGTIASALDILDAARTDPSTRKLLRNPYALDPDPTRERTTKRRRRPPIQWEPKLGRFIAPFFMGPVNSLVVRRSNALFGQRYGAHLEYEETMVAGDAGRGLPGALGYAVGLAGFVAAASFPPTRRLLERKIPKPGEGPSERQRTRGFFKMVVYAAKEGDAQPCIATHVESDGDPGYAATARMLGESALCLALDPPQPGFEGGVLTPATAMGDALVGRLQRAGMRLESGSI